ncbi:hypothetical protein G9A89_010478 [Geosiphon pyriformis]|nr:hypothetical protein G9A89_010478 [Geosiphon pyriformis]
MNKFVKSSGSDISSKNVVYRKKRKSGVLKDNTIKEVVLAKKKVVGFWGSNTSNITKLNSIDMKEEFLMKKTSIDYDQAVVLKKIPIGTLTEAVCTALSEFGVIKLIKIQLFGLWQKAVVEFD